VAKRIQGFSLLSAVLSVRKNFPAFITGASGFIGGRIAERLLADGRKVRVLSRRPLPGLEAKGAEVVLGDLDDRHALERGCRSAETVFHVAGRVGVWGPRSDFFHINVGGTERLLAACREAGVQRFVYTSSPSVVYNGGDLRNVDESAPLCLHAPCAYPTSKAAAELAVLQAHSPNLATIALRPHLVWGPGDKNVVPRIITLARAGKLKMVGEGTNKVDITHIANVVDAHLLAEGALMNVAGGDDPGTKAPPGSAPPATAKSPGGRAYFITNGEPVRLWEWINRILKGVGLPPVTKNVPLPMAYLAGGLCEAWWRVTGKAGEPPMTRFVAKELATDHWFNIAAARRDLGYHPLVTVEDGTAELIEHYRKGNAF
jgi:nucleoside-diphosphate-sugar epimerase